MKKFTLSLLLIALFCFSINAQTSLTTAVDFETTDCHGEPFHLFEILDGGQYVLIDFFFVNCGPCQTVTPKIAQAYELLGCNAHDIFFLEISSMDSDAACLTWVETYGIEYPTISGQQGGGSSICNNYGIPAYPTIILIAPDRSIVIQDLWPISDANNIVNAVGAYGVNPNDCDATFAPPTNLISSLDFNVVELTWEAPEGKSEVTGYNVYKENELVAENITNTEFSEESEGGTFEYCVTAIYSDIESGEICTSVNVIFCDDEIDVIQLIICKDEALVHIEWTHVFNQHSGNFLHYNVYRDNEVIITTTDSYYIDINPPLESHMYMISAVYSDGCEAFSNEIECYPSIIGIKTYNSTFNIYPNPVDDYINIKLNDGTLSNKYVEIYNLVGNLVLKQKLSNTQINVSALSPGLYIINVNNVQQKFIKQ
ncbi:MAG: T9SS type A sorting domain-containing protein [Bacteroidales bacterium]|jgi:thiol-disulfide isomerase/thioredoxin|nr:T9SS type A sorting domain-containing protein [Bacteroidales bacterium]